MVFALPIHQSTHIHTMSVFDSKKNRQIVFTQKSVVEKCLRFHTMWFKLPCPFKMMINLILSLTGCGLWSVVPKPKLRSFIQNPNFVIVQSKKMAISFFVKADGSFRLSLEASMTTTKRYQFIWMELSPKLNKVNIS